MACAAEVTRGRWIAPGGKVAAAAVRARCIQRRATPHPVWPLLPGARPLSTWLRLTQSDTREQIDERSAKNVETTLSVSARGCPLDGRLRGVGRRTGNGHCLHPALRPGVQSPEVLRDQGHAAHAREYPGRQPVRAREARPGPGGASLPADAEELLQRLGLLTQQLPGEPGARPGAAAL